MSKELDISAVQQDRPLAYEEINIQKENQQKKFQMGTERTIEDISISIHPLVSLPTSDMTMNCSALHLRKQYEIILFLS